ncbi:hypothetical protein CMV_027508 [Castanea mollissima]|uniref:Uncharacterized protein n=1 Tax=Castanea mollissima TaxID=60419 RepID=A0A8J4VEZ1_9ROSI|nr:hypothetical protein CMV_027508 [Castanea mollissima]
MTSTENSTNPFATNSSYCTGQASAGMEDPFLNPFFLSSSVVLGSQLASSQLRLKANNVYTSPPPSNSSSNGGSSSTPSAPLVPGLVVLLPISLTISQASFCRGRRSQSDHNLNVLSIETSAKASFNIKELFRKIAAALPGMETLFLTNQEDMVDVNLKSSNAFAT